MGTKRIGLARTQALIENLKRSLDFNGATFTDTVVNTSQAATMSGTNTLSGTTTVSGNLTASAYKTGMVGVTHSATITCTSGQNGAASGALAVPAHCIILDVGVVVTTLITLNASAKLGMKAGTTASGQEIANNDVDAISNASTTIAVGKGTCANTAIRTSLGGLATMVLDADAAYAASARDIHITLTSNSTFANSNGRVRMWVKYVHVEG